MARPGPRHPGFDPREIDVDMDVCRWCATHVPADEIHRVKHEDWDQRIANRFAQLMERVALLEATVAHLSGVGERETGRLVVGRESRHDPAPDPTSPPTPAPAQEASTGAGRAGAEGGDSNQHKRPPAASEPPHSPDGTTPPDGSIAPGRPSGGRRGRPAATSPAAGRSAEEAEQIAYERRLMRS